MKKRLLEFKNVSCTHANMPALKNLNFSVFEGEYIGIIGSDSSGKMTIFQLLAGGATCTDGEILLSGTPFTPHSIRESQQKKVFCISSTSSLIDSQTIAENIFLNHVCNRQFKLVNDKLIINEAQDMLNDFGLNLDAKSYVFSLSVANECIVELLKSHMLGARLIVLHDIMTLGTKDEYAMFLKTVKRIVASGTSILLLNNRYTELFDSADRILLLSNDGRLMRTLYKGEFSEQQVNTYLSGFSCDYKSAPKQSTLGDELLKAVHFSTMNYKDVNFTLHEKEVLGLHYSDRQYDSIPLALSGSCAYTGQLWVRGKPVDIRNPADAIRYGIGLIPANLEELYFPDLTIKENVSLLFMKRLCEPFGILNPSRMKTLLQDVEAYLDTLEQEFPHPEYEDCIYPILTRYLLYPFCVIIVMHPSAKNDVAKTKMLFRFIDQAASRGCGLIVASTKIDELRAICTSIYSLDENQS